MKTIALNKRQEKDLLRILKYCEDQKEAKEFIDMIKSATSFYMGDESDDYPAKEIKEEKIQNPIGFKLKEEPKRHVKIDFNPNPMIYALSGVCTTIGDYKTMVISCSGLIDIEGYGQKLLNAKGFKGCISG